MSIYMGNLSLETTEDELRKEFTKFGEVLFVTIMDDKYIGSGQTRGYGYVEMTSKSEGATAITRDYPYPREKLRNQIVNIVEALPLSDKPGTAPLSIRSKSRLNKKRERRYIVE